MASFLPQPGLACPAHSPCCVECAFGKGMVILSAIHVEWACEVGLMGRYDPWELKLGGSIDGLVTALRETKGKWEERGRVRRSNNRMRFVHLLLEHLRIRMPSREYLHLCVCCFALF